KPVAVTQERLVRSHPGSADGWCLGITAVFRILFRSRDTEVGFHEITVVIAIVHVDTRADTVIREDISGITYISLGQGLIKEIAHPANVMLSESAFVIQRSLVGKVIVIRSGLGILEWRVRIRTFPLENQVFAIAGANVAFIILSGSKVPYGVGLEDELSAKAQPFGNKIKLLIKTELRVDVGHCVTVISRTVQHTVGRRVNAVGRNHLAAFGCGLAGIRIDDDRSERSVHRGWEHENAVVNRIHARTGRTLALHITTQTDVTVQTAGKTHIHIRAEVDPDIVGIGIITILIGFENSVLV